MRGVGLGLLVAPVTSAALNSLSTSQAAMVSMLMSLSQQIGGSLGIAILATALDMRTRVYAAAHVDWSPELASLHGFEDAYLGAAVFVALAVLLAFRLPRRPARALERACDA